MINIALCTDENYVVPCFVTITSIFENNKGEAVCVYILTDFLSPESNKKFETLAQRYGQAISIIKVNINTYSNLVINKRYTKATYYRFLLPDIIKDESTVLYLDCDILVRGSLRELFDVKINDYSCAVVEDTQCDDVIHKNRIQYNGAYFNAGVLLINLNYWREHNVSQELVSFIEQHPERCYYNDQDALNIVLEEKVLFLPYTYNFQERWFQNLNTLNFLYTKHKLVYECISNPLIVHFTLAIKPWYKECAHPLASEWISYLAKSGMDYKLKYYHSIQYRIKRFFYKIFRRIKKL